MDVMGELRLHFRLEIVLESQHLQATNAFVSSMRLQLRDGSMRPEARRRGRLAALLHRFLVSVR